MSDTNRLKLPFIASSQAQKHVTHNEALLTLDTLVQASVTDRNLTIPPANPAEGDCYIPASGAVDAWAGRDMSIATWQDGTWKFHAPVTGWLVHIIDENIMGLWNGAEWIDLFSTIGSLQNLSLLGINASADQTNRLAVSSDAILFNNAGNGIQAKLNKNTQADTASILFQTGWSGRAEFGLAGNDDLTAKVSADGNNWFDSFSIDGTSGLLTVSGGLSTGTTNTRFGFDAGTNNSGNYQTVSGVSAGRNNSGNYQNANGVSAGYSNSGDNQTASGTNSGRSNSGSGQTVSGVNSGYNNSGDFQTAIGVNAGYGNSGIYNTACGYLSGYSNSGNRQTCIGVNAGRDNTANDVTAIGFGANFQVGYENSTAIGYNSLCTSSNQVRLGNDNVSEVFSSGSFVSGSFIRPKAFTVATVPNAATSGAGAIVYLSNESGGANLAFSDGTDWRRVSDRAVIS